MREPDPIFPETDPRFPSGPWEGFFEQRSWRLGRHTMKMDLAFWEGQLSGKGADWVGAFTLKGDYNRADGKCRWTKKYLGKHKVSYQGSIEGNGIWGEWELTALFGLIRDRGIFHIWPEGRAPTTEGDLTERALLGESPRTRWLKISTAMIWLGGLLAIYFLWRYYQDGSR